MIGVTRNQWFDLVDNNNFHFAAGAVREAGPVVARIFNARCLVPKETNPWIIFEFDDPKQETFVRLKYL